MQSTNILLSQVVVGRNDNYLGNFKQRIEMTINYNAASVAEAGFLDRYEMLVVDWNSDTPLREALNLNKFALQCVKFLEVTPEIIATHIGKGPIVDISRGFNVGIRRTESAMVMVGPADVLIPAPAMRAFFHFLQSSAYANVDITHSYLGMERFLIPWQAAERLTSDTLERYLLVHTLGMNLETRVPGVASGEGAHIFSHKAIHEVQGFNEEYGGWGTQDIEVSLRIMQRGPLLKLTHAGVYCYDLQQRPTARASIQPEKQNVPLVEKANNANWGLANVLIEKQPAIACPHINNESGVDIHPYDTDMAGNCCFALAPLNRVGRACRKLFSINCLQTILNIFSTYYIGKKQKNTGRLMRKIHAVLNRVAFQYLLYEGMQKGVSNGKDNWYFGDWFGDRDALYSYLEFALERRLHHKRISWSKEKVSSLFAIVATLGKQHPRRFLYVPRREGFVAWAVSLVDPTMEVTGYDDGRNIDKFSKLHGWEAGCGNYYQSEVPNFDTLDLQFSGFKGSFHTLTGPVESAFERLKDGAIIGEPYQAMYLELDFLGDILPSLYGKLNPLMDRECSVICSGSSENLALLDKDLRSGGFEVVGKLPGVTIYWRG